MSSDIERNSHVVIQYIAYKRTLHLNPKINVYRVQRGGVLRFLKCCLETVGNRISESLDFKIFLGEHAPGPPSMAHVFGVRLMCEKS